MILKEYQEEAIVSLLKNSTKLLRHSGKKLVLKAPTGSGKTIIMAEFLKRFVEENENFSFIWIAPRKLHSQSKEKLEHYFKENRSLECSLFEDLIDRKIEENQILFFNWESINRVDGYNLYIRENEQEFYLSKVLDNTREDGRKIILIIDESHYSTDTDNANNLKALFNADLTIEVSATPVLSNPDAIVTVDIEDVKLEGMIKKSVILNEGMDNAIINGEIESKMSNDSDELVIEEGLKKREQLKKAYKKEGVDINPLIIIQLPSVIRQAHEDLKNNIIRLLNDKYGINTANEKLGIYLAEQQENIDEIALNNNVTEVLLFKQGLALGWDCPRAQILILFREWHSSVFSIQTVGRIMRMPEPDKGHYEDDILNHAYIYTNLSNILLQDQIAKDYITIYLSERKKEYKPVNLMSYHIKRQREKTRLSPLFITKFLVVARKNKLKEKLSLNKKNISLEILSNYEIKNIHNANVINEEGELIDYNLSEDEMQRYFDNFIIHHLTPFYPEDRSIGRVKDAIYRFFDESLKMDYSKNQKEIMRIVLNPDNNQKFIDAIDEAKNEYQKEVLKKEKEIVESPDWNLPIKIRYNENYNQKKCKKSIMNPFFIDGNWKPEEKFIDYIENNSKNIDWWFKNGDRDAIFFAVPYELENEINPFYIDFIIKFKDGKIGLFDTKTGITLRDAKEKSDGLQKYISKYSTKKQPLFGGLVTNTDQKNLTGRWIYYDGKGKDLSDKDWSKWKNVDL